MSLTPVKNNMDAIMERFKVPHTTGTMTVLDDGFFTGRFYYYQYAAF